MKPSMEQIKADPENRKSGVDCDYCDTDIESGVTITTQIPAINIGAGGLKLMAPISYVSVELHFCWDCLWDMKKEAEKS